MKNRFMLAPMTNQQSHDDGTLSDDEFHWLTMRAKGGFALTETCAVHVQVNGKTWPGQLGAFDDRHIDGLKRLATGIHAHDSLAVVQLFHGGRRAPPELHGGQAPRSPSDDLESGAVGLTTLEVHQLRDDFILSARRCEKAGFDGVEIHAAHGFLICQFLSPEFNRRNDAYGGSPENRARLLDEIIAGIRKTCGDSFTVGVRLSPDQNGLVFGEMLNLARRLLTEGNLDFLDMSMHDAFKWPQAPEFADRPATEWFAELSRGDTRLGVSGNLRTPDAVRRVMGFGVDFVIIGRAAILHHDFPVLMQQADSFECRSIPVSAEILRHEGVSETFVNYLKTFPGFVQD